MPRTVGPVGQAAARASGARARRSPAYREAQQENAPYEALARIVIKHRTRLRLTQEELAAHMGTSHSAISRIESGRHRTSVATLRRLAAALGLRFVVGFESGPVDQPVRDLIVL